MYEGTMYTVRRRIVLFLLIVCSFSLSAQDFAADRELLDAYKKEEMSVWKSYIDTASLSAHLLSYEYGYCGYIVSLDKEAAKPYVSRFRTHVEACSTLLPVGHYEMYMSAVYVFELRLHESFHPVKAMNLAKEAVKKAPADPLTLSYLGTSLFYAPRPFGSKKEALQWFEEAQKYFRNPQWQYRWEREANEMYIHLCHDKYHL